MRKIDTKIAPIDFLLFLFAIGQIAYPLKIEKLSISPTLPVRGEEMDFRAELINEENYPITDINISVFIVKDEKEAKFNQLKIIKLEPKERRRLSLGKWRSKESGQYSLKVVASRQNKKTIATFSFAVVERKVEFAWYGTPKDLRWATISTTIEKDYIDEWLWEGRTPLVFKPGVCFWDKHNEAPVEEQVKCWEEIPEGAEGIGIDEYGESEAGEKVKSAIKMFKERNPDRKLALWTTGGIPNDIASYVDYFLPEVYLNYHNMHLGILERTIRNVQEKKLERKTLLGLGINYEPKQGTLLTTPEELEAQFRLIKERCPDILGIAIFYYGSVPSLDRLSDSLFYKYFILPVVTCKWEIKIPRSQPRIEGEVENIGNIQSGEVEVSLYIDKRQKKTKKMPGIKAREKKPFSYELSDLGKGIHVVEIKLRISGEATVISQDKKEAIAIGIPELKSPDRLGLWLPPYPQRRENQPIRFAKPSGWRSAKVFLLNSRGDRIRELKSQPNNWGEIVWIDEEIPAGEERFYLLQKEDSSSEVRQLNERDFSNPFYQVGLNIKGDEIRYLKISDEEIFSSPWKIEMSPNYGIEVEENEVQIVEGPIFREIKVPFKGEVIRGYSDYIFYHSSPIIEIRRTIIPERELSLQNAREGAGFPQRGGKYQAFTGDGALRISKGKLIDSDEYRDIYFGYLGVAPSPDNFRKAGWFDFSWDEPPIGLGVGIIERWQDSQSRTYDVTRYYDGGDWIDIFYVFQINAKLTRPQSSFIILLPHQGKNLAEEAPILPYYWTEKNPARKINVF